MNRISFIGRKIGNRTITKEYRNQEGREVIDCKCNACGKVSILFRFSPGKQSSQNSCHCLYKEQRAFSAICASRRTITHNATHTKLWRAWWDIREKCNKPNNRLYNISGGGAGFFMCDEWVASYANFEADMGEAPKGLSRLKLKEGCKEYCKENCYWSQPNASLTHAGRDYRYWADMLGVRRNVFQKCATRKGITGAIASYSRLRNIAVEI